MRLETVTNRNPKTDDKKCCGEVGEGSYLCAGDRFELKEAPHDRYEEERASIDDGVR